MTKILLLSDTHSFIDEQILKYVHQADEVWHAGDIGSEQVTEKIKALKPLRAVYGNIDDATLRLSFKENEHFDIEGFTVWMTHIAGHPNRYESSILKQLKEKKIDLLVCGHSHILRVMYDTKNGFLYLNPGACGTSGFHQVRTMLRFELDNTQIKNMEIIELGHRI